MPVIVIVAVDDAAELFAVSVSVLVVVVVAGLNNAVTPSGRPDAARLTESLKPFCALIVIVLVLLVPAMIPTVDAELVRLKDCGPVLPVKVLISGWPVGLPHPVARS